MNKKIKWGIIGLGNSAKKFTQDLARAQNSALHSVASRDREKAKQFSQDNNDVTFYDSYKELAQNSGSDIVYITTPHAFHFEHTMMCLKEGKSVLCEKPLGMNANEIEEIIKEAKSRNLFLMEGLSTRFLPSTEKALSLIEKKFIGDITSIRADFGFNASSLKGGRLFDKKLGGGSLLDIGIYPIYLSLILLGTPSKIKAMARFTDTEVDSFCAMLFDYENNAKAILDSNLETMTSNEAYIYGTRGVLKLHRNFSHAQKISIFINGKPVFNFDLKFEGNGYLHEIEEVNNCLLNGKIESEKLPHTASLNLAQIMDRVKDEIGLDFES